MTSPRVKARMKRRNRRRERVARHERHLRMIRAILSGETSEPRVPGIFAEIQFGKGTQGPTDWDPVEEFVEVGL